MLSQNQPNPFVAERGATAIGFMLGESAQAKLRIFDASGRLVRVLVDEHSARGRTRRGGTGAVIRVKKSVRDLLLPS